MQFFTALQMLLINGFMENGLELVCGIVVLGWIGAHL
jgi:hypothetical protein